jgi:RHS repeat-associated protein
MLSQNDTATGDAVFLHDGHGSTRMLSDMSEQPVILQEYQYDAFGNLCDDGVVPLTDYLYSGEQTDATGMQYLRARYYDPAVGRFSSLDPLGHRGGFTSIVNGYYYADGNPVTYCDPSGQIATLADMMQAVKLQGILAMCYIGMNAFINLGFQALADPISADAVTPSGRWGLFNSGVLAGLGPMGGVYISTSATADLFSSTENAKVITGLTYGIGIGMSIKSYRNLAGNISDRLRNGTELFSMVAGDIGSGVSVGREAFRAATKLLAEDIGGSVKKLGTIGFVGSNGLVFNAYKAKNVVGFSITGGMTAQGKYVGGFVEGAAGIGFNAAMQNAWDLFTGVRSIGLGVTVTTPSRSPFGAVLGLSLFWPNNMYDWNWRKEL